MDIEGTDKVNHNKKIKSKFVKSTDQFKTKVEDFKQPKSSIALILERRDDRHNRNSQVRKNKINDYILKKRGILDSDATDSSLNMTAKSFSKNMSMTNLTNLIDTTIYKVPPKLSALVALNASCNLDSLMTNFENVLKEDIEKGNKNENSCYFYKPNENMWTALVPPSLYKGKERISLIKTSRDIYSILDICKVVDNIIFVSSCKDTEFTKWKTDPDKFSHSIDEFGYKILSMLRAQGLPQHICVLQDLNSIPDKHKSDIKKLFNRYFESELKPDKILNLSGGLPEEINKDEYKTAIRLLCAISPFSVSLDIRKHRSYMLVEKINTNTSNELEVYGYLRGNTLNINNYVHITGFGDYLVKSINIDEDTVYSNSHQSFSANIKVMDIDQSIPVKNNKGKENIDNKIENTPNIGETKPCVIGKEMVIPNLNHNLPKTEIDDDIDFDIQIGKDDDLSFDEIEEDDEEEGRISKKHINKTAIKYRTLEEMEFPDEVDTPIDIPSRERFKKFRGLASMKQGSWDPLEDLPKEYANIYSFENLRYLYKLAVKKAHEEGLKLSGNFVKITLIGFNKEDLIYKLENIQLVLSTLLEHERKLCVMHYKISLNYESNLKISSKQTLETHCGFRRILTKPIYSSEIGGGINDKLKIEKCLEKDKFYYATVYSQLTYPNSPILLFGIDKEKSLVAYGNSIDTDSKKVIMKRIILTGYPLKIKKKRAVVRYMFFNPGDVNYFKPVQLVTKAGLRGHITESLGTHGYMKCVFSDYIKANDTVCLNLYKRVFPKWFKESWRYKVCYGNKADYLSYFEKKEKETPNMILD